MSNDTKKDTDVLESEAQAQRIAELEKKLAETESEKANTETKLAEAEKKLSENKKNKEKGSKDKLYPNTEKKVRIRLDRVSGKSNVVFVSVGERSWKIKRGVYVDIPKCAYDVLRNAEAAEDIAAAYIESAVN